jgi:hypothetical protein
MAACSCAALKGPCPTGYALCLVCCDKQPTIVNQDWHPNTDDSKPSSRVCCRVFCQLWLERECHACCMNFVQIDRHVARLCYRPGRFWRTRKRHLGIQRTDPSPNDHCGPYSVHIQPVLMGGGFNLPVPYSTKDLWSHNKHTGGLSLTRSKFQ